MMVIGDMYYKEDKCKNPTPKWLFWGGLASGVTAFVGVLGGLQRWYTGWEGDIEGGKYESIALLGYLTCCQNFFQMIVLIAVGIASI